MNIKNLLQNFIEQKLDEMKQPYAVVDTADSNKVVATASDEKGAKQSIASSERPPMSIKDKNTLKIVKTRKKQAIGHPLVEEVSLDEKVEVDHSRYMRSHGKKARGRGMWVFTSKDMGSPSNDEMVTVNGDLASAAKEAAKKLGTNRVYVMEEVELDEVSQALGHKVAKARQAQASQLRQKAVDEPDMMKAFAKTKAANTAEKKAGKSYNRLVRKTNEEVELTEDVHNDLNDSIIDFQKKLMRMSRQLDPTVAKEIKKIDKMLDDLRSGPLFKIRPGR
jgi:hypothetical protein